MGNILGIIGILKICIYNQYSEYLEFQKSVYWKIWSTPGITQIEDLEMVFGIHKIGKMMKYTIYLELQNSVVSRNSAYFWNWICPLFSSIIWIPVVEATFSHWNSLDFGWFLSNTIKVCPYFPFLPLSEYNRKLI